MANLKDKKVWGPLAGVAALAAGWYNGVGIPAEEAAGVAEDVAVWVEHAEALYASGAAVLLVVAGWFGWKK